METRERSRKVREKAVDKFKAWFGFYVFNFP